MEQTLSGNLFRFSPCLAELNLNQNNIGIAPKDLLKYNTLLTGATFKDNPIDLANYRCPTQKVRLFDLATSLLLYRTPVKLIFGNYFIGCDKCQHPPEVPESLSFTCWQNNIEDTYTHHPPTVCPQGSWCNTSTLTEFKCPKDTFNPDRGLANPAACKPCPKNSYNPFEGQTTCRYQCLGRTLSDATNAAAPCTACKIGMYAVDKLKW